MSRRHNTISFLTDYGTTDEFVGVVKAVIRDIAPHATVLDLTHEVPPFDVKAGSLALARCISYVPEGIVLAVVDPGVGSDRRAIAVEVAGGAGVLIGPDNGLLAPAVAMAGGAERAVEITNPDYRLVAPGATFDGRDVFGPAAAHLCNGVPLDALGPEVDAALLMPATIPLPREEGDEVIAEVLWVDRFGNCQLNIGPDDLPASWPVSMSLRLPDPHQHGQTVIRSAIRADHFAAIGHGIGVVLDSYGMYAVSLDRRSAADDLGLAPGDQVVLAAGTDDQPGGGPVTTPVNLGR